MRIRLTIFSVTVILLSASIVQADIYTCKDANGNAVYTDSPGGCENAEEIKVDTLPTLVPSKSLAVPRNNSSAGKEDDKDAYGELVITSPSNGSTLRDNQGNVTINFRASPALQTRKGHKYVVMVNGAEVYSGTSTITALKNVDRGTHNILVKIIDPAGSTKISASPVKVTVQRFSGLQNQENTFNDGDSDSDNNSNNNDEDKEDDEANRNNSFSFPTNTKFNRPATPPPAAN
ncbi:MAG: DUF4124 domain-containing protein [Gammaproteobacteria bacterium]